METHPNPEPPGPAPVLRRIETLGWGLLAVFLAGAALFFRLPEAGGVALGGALALGSLRGMDIYFARIFRRGGPRPRWWHHALHAGRFLLLLAGVAAALGWLGMPVVGLVVGLSVPLAAISLYGVLALARGESAG